MAQRGGPLIHKKLHICLYRSDNLETVLKFDPLSRTELAYTELMIEVTEKPTQDFFVDSEILEDAIEESTSHEFATSSNDSRFGEFVDRAWGQHTMYVTEIIVRQCRVCVFSIALFGSRAGIVQVVSYQLHLTWANFAFLSGAFLADERCGAGPRSNSTNGRSRRGATLPRHYQGARRPQTVLEGAELDRALPAHYQPVYVLSHHIVRLPFPRTMGRG